VVISINHTNRQLLDTMNKLYWIVCENMDATLFEGRFQGRTRGAAIKFLKTALGRSSLKGLVFTISEIPVHLIREIVAEMLSMPLDNIGAGVIPAASVQPINAPAELPCTNGDDQLIAGGGKPALSSGPTAVLGSVGFKPRRTNMRKVGNPGLGDDFWKKVQTHWNQCRSIRDTSIKFGLSQNSVKTRARREGWRKDIPPA
jgi:hypothetical protein